MKIGRLIRDFAVTMLVLIAISCVGMRIVFDIPFYNYWRWCVGGVVVVLIVGLVAFLVDLALYPNVGRLYLAVLKKKLSGRVNR